MRTISILILIGVSILVSTANVQAYGTAAGTIVTNARDLGFATYADVEGDLVVSYTNIAGSTNRRGPEGNITVFTVSAKYDLSVINQPADGTGASGSYAEYTYSVTNRGNISDRISITAASNTGFGSSFASLYSIYTNGVLAKGPSSTTIWTSQWIPNDSALPLIIRVNIPGTAVDSATNWYLVTVRNYGGVGDSDFWPPAGAILPATPDVANLRGTQIDAVKTTVTGPIIQISKTINITSVGPYEEVTYTISYTNSGSVSAYNVQIIDAIPITYSVIVSNSAAANNNPAADGIAYDTDYDDALWNGGQDTFAQRQAITRVRWTRNSVATGTKGTLEFKVQVE